MPNIPRDLLKEIHAEGYIVGGYCFYCGNDAGINHSTGHLEVEHDEFCPWLEIERRMNELMVG